MLSVLVVLGAVCLFLIGGQAGQPASVQAQQQSTTEGGIIVVPIQLERDSYGLAMVDTKGQTLWIYELSRRGATYDRLRLVAARSWRYDRLLQQYNTAEPKPDQVRALLQNLIRQQREAAGKK